MTRREVTYRWVGCGVRDRKGLVRDFQQILNYDVKRLQDIK